MSDRGAYELHTELEWLPDDARNVTVEVVAVDGRWVQLRVTCDSDEWPAILPTPN